MKARTVIIVDIFTSRTAGACVDFDDWTTVAKHIGVVLTTCGLARVGSMLAVFVIQAALSVLWTAPLRRLQAVTPRHQPDDYESLDNISHCLCGCGKGIIWSVGYDCYSSRPRNRNPAYLASWYILAVISEIQFPEPRHPSFQLVIKQTAEQMNATWIATHNMTILWSLFLWGMPPCPTPEKAW